jgi:undecaprenyl-diphosphatase
VLGVGAAAVATFAMLADEVGEGHTTGFDAAVRAWTQARRSEALVPAFVAVTRAGSMYVTGPVGVLVALWLWRARGARVAAAAVATPVAALSTIGALKVLFFRARPPGALADPGLAHALNYSFPSGHSAGSMAIATTLAYVLARERLAPRWAVALAVAFALLVGVSRVYLDVHWPTDVIGGWAVGLAFAAGGVALYERLRHAARHAERAARAGAPGEAPPARADVAA